MLKQCECMVLAWTISSFGQVLPMLHIQKHLRFTIYSSSLWFSKSVNSDMILILFLLHDQEDRSKQCLVCKIQGNKQVSGDSSGDL